MFPRKQKASDSSEPDEHSIPPEAPCGQVETQLPTGSVALGTGDKTGGSSKKCLFHRIIERLGLEGIRKII